MTCRAVKKPGSAGNIDPVEVIPKDPVRIGSRKNGKKRIINKDRIARIGHPVMVDVEDITVDPEDRHSERSCSPSWSG